MEKTPIEIDLRNLTDEMVAIALPNRSECDYTSPCIIGTLMTDEDRVKAQKNCLDIRGLVSDGVVSMPENQVNLAFNLQVAFDNEETNFEEVLQLVRSELSDD